MKQNQESGNIIIIVCIITLIGVVASILYLYGSIIKKPVKTNTIEPTSSNKAITSIDQSENPTRLENEIYYLKKQLNPTIESFVKCKKDMDEVSFILPNLPEQLRNKTSDDKGPSKTYDIYQLAWSDDCKLLSFYLELVARGGGYDEVDFKSRGLYILNSETNELTTVRLLKDNESISRPDTYVGRTYWIEDKFIFTVLIRTTPSQIIANHYAYDFANKTIKLHPYN